MAHLYLRYHLDHFYCVVVIFWTLSPNQSLLKTVQTRKRGEVEMTKTIIANAYQTQQCGISNGLELVYETLGPEFFKNCQGEVEKYRHLIAHYCYKDERPGVGAEIASQGITCVPWAISYDLPEKEFMHYSGGHAPKGPIHLRGHANKLPFESDSLDFLCSSHYAEDLPRSAWPALFGEWKRVLKAGGYMIVLVPEVGLWAAYLAAGGPCNCSHNSPEPSLGDMSKVATELGMEVVEERLTNCYQGDYSILGVFKRV